MGFGPQAVPRAFFVLEEVIFINGCGCGCRFVGGGCRFGGGVGWVSSGCGLGFGGCERLGFGFV